ncbi:MAG: hypothetical protein J6W25_05260 [Bacilli bacterium]|nr:hypothetical protein [Bacilli bacterium]
MSKDEQGSNLFPAHTTLLSFDEERNYQKVEINTVIDEANLLDDEEYGKKVYRWSGDDIITFNINVATSDEYELALDYKSLQNDVQDITVNVRVDGVNNDDYANACLPTYWTDSSREEVYDIYQNEVNQMQVRYDVWSKYFLYDQRYYNDTPMSIYLTSGAHTIEIEKATGDLLLGDIYIFEKSSYSNYEKPNNVASSDKMIVL